MVKPTNYPTCPVCGADEGWQRQASWRVAQTETIWKVGPKGEMLDTPVEGRVLAGHSELQVSSAKDFGFWQCRYCEKVPLISLQRELDEIFKKVDR
jgi:hypothetical protein